MTTNAGAASMSEEESEDEPSLGRQRIGGALLSASFWTSASEISLTIVGLAAPDL
jgi:hypothetical protein